MSFITKKIEKKLGVDLDGDGMVGGRRHGAPAGYHQQGQGNNALMNELEKTTNIDLNGDGRIGAAPIHHPNSHHSGSGGLINKIERSTNMDLNGDGSVGGRPNYHPNYPSYGGPSHLPPHSSNFQQSGGNNGMINELEKATNIDINRDGRIGGQQGYPPNYPSNFNQYGGPPNYPPNSGGGASMINELEKATNIDINRDGRIGGQQGYPPNYPPNFQQPGGNNGMINELEKATNIDINRDGRIGGQPGYPPNYPPNFNQYSGPPNYPPNSGGGASMINELEKATNIDINRDGRIGGQPGYPPNYPPNFNQYGGPPNYPPTGSGGAGLINELEKTTNIDLNGDGRIGAQSSHQTNYNLQGYGY